jgi:hypothetical protein
VGSLAGKSVVPMWHCNKDKCTITADTFDASTSSGLNIRADVDVKAAVNIDKDAAVVKSGSVKKIAAVENGVDGKRIRRRDQQPV